MSSDVRSTPGGLRGNLHWLSGRMLRGLFLAHQEILARHALTNLGYLVLVELVSGPSRNQLGLAHATCIDKSKMVGVLDELERHAMVVRTPDPTDRRARIIEVTDHGQAALRAAQVDIDALEERLFTEIDADRAQFCDSMLRLIEGPLSRVNTDACDNSDAEGKC